MDIRAAYFENEISRNKESSLNYGNLTFDARYSTLTYREDGEATQAECADLYGELPEAVPDPGHDAALHHDAVHGPGQITLLRSLLCSNRIHKGVR